jgi:hypothetical protein
MHRRGAASAAVSAVAADPFAQTTTMTTMTHAADASAAAAAPPSALALLLSCGSEAPLVCVLSFLDARSLAHAACVSRALCAAAAAPPLWHAACAADWAGKAYVPAAAHALRASGDPAGAFRLARADARRDALTHDELLSLPWRFRFKAAAGGEWTARDPFWRGAPPTRVAFRADGTVLRTAGDNANANAPADVNADATAAAAAGAGTPVWPDVPIIWRWARFGAGRHAAAPAAARGTLLRCRVAGRDVPTYAVSRHAPSWGWLMQSCWGLYTSWDMPPLGADATLDDEG